MPDDDRPAVCGSNVVPFPGNATRPGSTPAPDLGGAAASLTNAARSLEQALERQHAELRDWCATIENLARAADTLADDLRLLQAQSRPIAPSTADQSTANEP